MMFIHLDMKFYYILVSCISACVNLETDKATMISPSPEVLLNFLEEFHEEVCGNFTWCGDNLNQTELRDERMVPVACCLPCSCSHTCRRRRNCCPDYLIKQDYTTVPFTQATSQPIPLKTQATSTRHMLGVGNSHSTLPVVQNSGGHMLVPTKYPVSHSDSARDPENNIDKTVLANYSARTVCVKPEVAGYQNIHLETRAYEMVVSCPISFQDDRTRSRCNEEIDNEYLYDTIPVTSSYTGITYANRHCLMCNELYTFQNVSFSPWQVLLILKTSTYVPLEFHDNFQPIKHLFDRKLSYYGNIHFVPPNVSFAQPCQQFDVTKCNQTGLWDIYNRNVELVCEFGTNFPVAHEITNGPLMFKNSACLKCNVPREDLKTRRFSCDEKSSGTPLYSMTINQQYIDNSRSAMPDTYNVSWPKQNSSVCPPGYVEIMNICKKLLCPRDYYRDSDSCIPFYGIISGLNLHLKLEIIIPSLNSNTTMRHEFAETLKSKLKDTMQRLMSIPVLDSSLWYRKKSKKSFEEYYLYNVYFFDPSNKLDFGLAISSIQTVWNTLRQESRLTLRNGHTVELQYGFGHKIIISKSSLRDIGMQTFGPLVPLMGSDWRLKVYNPSMTISDSNWCDRIALSQDEFKAMSRGVFKIRWTNKIVYTDQFGITEDLFVLLCVDLFKDLIGRDEKHSDNIVIAEENSGTPESPWAISKPGILTWSLVGVILVCIVFYRTKTIIHKKFSEQV